MILPLDTLGHIFSYLTPPERVPLLFVNKRFNSIAELEYKPKAKKLVKLAARTGSITFAEWLYPLIKQYSCTFSHIAAEHKHLNLLKWAQEKKIKLFNWTFIGAAKGGDLATMIWLKEQGCPFDADVFIVAATGGHLDAVKWLITNLCPWDKNINFAIGGNIEMITYLYANGAVFNFRTADSAAKSGKLDILKFLKTNGSDFDINTLYQAAEGGHLEVVKWLRENGCPWSEMTFTGALGGGNMKVIEWLYSNGCPWNKDDFSYFPIQRGDIQVIRFLFEKGVYCEKGSSPCCLAASGGQLTMLKFLIQNNYPLSPEAFHLAVNDGHLDVLEYLHMQGCPWNKELCPDVAAMKGHLKVLKFLISIGGIISTNTLKIAKDHGHLLVIKYLSKYEPS